MFRQFILFISLLLTFGYSKAQFTYSIDQTIPVEVNGKELSLAWAGGVNAAQVNTIDLNGDGHPDLAIFDRTAKKVITFLAVGKTYRYAPDFESLFPPEIDGWMLLRDFNCDGKKDIFTSDPFGIAVFVNTTQPGKLLSWRAFNPGFPLLTEGFSSSVNLKVNEDDVPAIDDIDGDGDLDILTVRFVGVGTLEWHQNLSIERTGRCDSLQLKRVTQTWGEFEECACGKIAMQGGKTCDQLLSGGRTQHTGGKSLATFDFNNDGVRDLFFSEESCTNLFLLSNKGTATDALVTDFSTFPSTNPVIVPYFPAAYIEDVDFDGLLDLVISPNIEERTTSGTNFQQSIYLYKNTGTSTLPQFTFSQNNFLQDQMLDVGDFSVPAFIDMDGDGDQDMFISSYAQSPYATIYQFENTGTTEKPRFKLINKDFFTLSLLRLYNMKIQFADMNADGKFDLVFSGTTNASGRTELQYLANSSNDKFLITDAQVKPTSLALGQAENWLVLDVDQDGWTDVLIGNDTGGIDYWKNQKIVNQNNYSLITSSFIGIGSSPDRQYLSMAATDLDADGRGDLITADQEGHLSIYGDFRAQNPSLSGTTNIIFSNLTKEYESRNLGGRVWPTTANLFNSDKPAIIAGNTLGGLLILKNDEGEALPSQPEISIYPNPYGYHSTLPLNIKADRNVLVQFLNMLGQRISGSYFIPANQEYQSTAACFLPECTLLSFHGKEKYTPNNSS